jgi:hypothetical protein
MRKQVVKEDISGRDVMVYKGQRQRKGKVRGKVARNNNTFPESKLFRYLNRMQIGL